MNELNKNRKIKNTNIVSGLIVFTFVLMLLAGAAFTGAHTYNLYYRGLGKTDTAALLAAVPVALIEGITLLSIAANFFYFKTPEQKFWGNVASWAGAILLTVNSIIDHNTNAAHDVPYALSVYSWLMLPGIPSLSLIYIKKILGEDPAIKKRQQEAELDSDFNDMLLNAEREVYAHPDVKRAIVDHKNDMSAALAANIRGRIGYAKFTVNNSDVPSPDYERVSKAAAALSAPAGPTQAEIGAMIQAAVAKALANAQPQAVAMNADAPTQARIIEAQSPK